MPGFNPTKLLLKRHLDKLRGAFVIRTYCEMSFLDTQDRVIEFIPKGKEFTVTAEWDDVVKTYYVKPTEPTEYQHLFPLSVYTGCVAMGWQIIEKPTLH